MTDSIPVQRRNENQNDLPDWQLTVASNCQQLGDKESGEPFSAADVHCSIRPVAACRKAAFNASPPQNLPNCCEVSPVFHRSPVFE